MNLEIVTTSEAETLALGRRLAAVLTAGDTILLSGRLGAGKTLFGAIVGGVIGHQFGSGRGNDAATVAGSLIGAAVANSGDRGPYYRTTEYSRPVTRCETNYQSHQEERIDGYDVVYRYHGQKYQTRMPYDPGRKLKIRVDVRPVD